MYLEHGNLEYLGPVSLKELSFGGTLVSLKRYDGLSMRKAHVYYGFHISIKFVGSEINYANRDTTKTC